MRCLTDGGGERPSFSARFHLSKRDRPADSLIPCFRWLSVNFARRQPVESVLDGMQKSRPSRVSRSAEPKPHRYLEAVLDRSCSLRVQQEWKTSRKTYRPLPGASESSPWQGPHLLVRSNSNSCLSASLSPWAVFLSLDATRFLASFFAGAISVLPLFCRHTSETFADMLHSWSEGKAVHLLKAAFAMKGCPPDRLCCHSALVFGEEAGLEELQ